MKKLISFVLTFALCLALLPSAALATGYETGIYLAQSEGNPSGECITVAERGGFGNNGDITLWGYWDIPYTQGQELTIYYYNAEITALTPRNNSSVSATKMNAGEQESHFWEITLTNTVSGEVWVDMDCYIGENSGGSFIITFAPIAPSYRTGIYTAVDNGAPAGDYFSMTGRTFDGVTVYGYWDLSYTPGRVTSYYYYDPSASSFGLKNSVDGISVSGVNGSDHLWHITLNSSFRGDDLVDFVADESMSFPIEFKPTAPSYTPGLYYKWILDSQSQNPYVSYEGPYLSERIVLSPYIDRSDIAFYFYDGAYFTPVDVGFGDSLAVDPVGVADQTGWYSFAAYDFCEGAIYYDDDNTHTTYTLDVTTCLPDYAFYAADTVSEENYRMYTIAADYEGPEADYKYVKELFFLPYQQSLDLSNRYMEVTCFQHQYRPNGNEVDEIPYTAFAYDIDIAPNGQSLLVTIFTNDSDVLFKLNIFEKGNDGSKGEWLCGSYVNVLAPDDDSSLLFHANNQGEFAAAKFLPKHIFRELAALVCGVTLSHEEFPGNITMDKSVVANIAAQTTPVSFCMTADAATEEEEATIAEALTDNETLLDVLNLKLYFGPDSVHELGGNAVIQYQADLPNGTQVKVYYHNNGQLEAMNATYEDGMIIFSTPHFSEFVIASAPEPVVPPRPNRPSRPSNSSTTAPVKPTEPEKPAAPDFADVPEDYWAKNAIDWAAEQGYVNGTSDTEFSPESNISRQQIWMILSRVNGAGAETMEEAAKWVEEQGISDGSNPGQAVTRQQLVTLLYRYAVLMGYDVSVGEDTNILSYDDASSVSEYAIPAFQWACGAGVVNGTSNSTLSPLGTASRAQFAVMLQRFCEKVVK